jgi:hypothetical protein
MNKTEKGICLSPDDDTDLPLADDIFVGSLILEDRVSRAFEQLLIKVGWYEV